MGKKMVKSKVGNREVDNISLDELLASREKLFKYGNELIRSKGHDYNHKQQQSGDTIYNMRLTQLMGITDTIERGIMVRLSDKLMRLVSLLDTEPKHESVKDTCVDIINYTSILYTVYAKRHAL